jgi:hypothetical protein
VTNDYDTCIWDVSAWNGTYTRRGLCIMDLYTLHHPMRGNSDTRYTREFSIPRL